MGIQKTIETLSKPPSLKGKLVEEEEESVTIHIGDSLFEIPKEHIKNMSEPESESKNIEIELSNDAVLVQKKLVIVKDVLGTVTADIFGAASGYSDDTECSYCICECSVCSVCITYCTFCPEIISPEHIFTGQRFRMPISRSRKFR